MTTNIEILREQCAHGNAMFPLMVHKFQTNPQFRERVSCHWHNELEILIVTEGAAQIQIDDKSYMVKEGRILFPEYICRKEPWQSQLHSVLMEICEQFENEEKAYELLIKANYMRCGISSTRTLR